MFTFQNILWLHIKGKSHTCAGEESSAHNQILSENLQPAKKKLIQYFKNLKQKQKGWGDQINYEAQPKSKILNQMISLTKATVGWKP